MIRKAAVISLLTILVSSPAIAYVHRESVEKKIPVGDRSLIVVNNPSGLVKVRPADGAGIMLEASKIVKAKSEDAAKDVAEDVKVRVVEGADEIEITVEIPSKYKHGTSIGNFLWISNRVHVTVDLYIQVPPSMEVKLATASGDIDVEGLGAGGDIGTTSGNVWLSDCSGDFAVGVASGEVEIEDIRGNLDLSAASGGINVRNIRGSVEVSVASGDFMGKMIEGSLKLDGASGEVTVEECGGAIDVSTASGDIVLKDVNGELSVNTSSGNVTVYAMAGEVVDIGIACSSGDIELRVPSESSYRLAIGSVSGSIHCKVPLSVEKVTRNELHGKVGSGRGSVSLNTSSGDIKVYEG